LKSPYTVLLGLDEQPRDRFLLTVDRTFDKKLESMVDIVEMTDFCNRGADSKEMAERWGEENTSVHE
jgi:hypothetical protein